MATSIREFNRGLYTEHLDEASFLYQQRQAYLHDVEVDWPDLEAWEERLEAHLDALVVGNDLALDVCRANAASGDAGMTHAALRVMGRHRRWDDAHRVLQALDLADGPVVRAAAEALLSDAPTSWREHLIGLLQSDRPLAAVAARAAGYRRFRCEDVLSSRLTELSPSGLEEVAWALGRVGTSAAVEGLTRLLASDDEGVCETAAIAIMRLGDDRPLRHAMESARTHRWARRVLGIGGGPKSVRILLDHVDGGVADVDTILSLGLLGDLSAVATLLDLLSHPELAGAAAVALNTITGAEQHARVFIPDDFDPDALLPKEREAYLRDGTVPTRAGEPFGSWQRRPLLDRAGWTAWLTAHRQDFTRGVRWRFGHPHGPGALFECLNASTSPNTVRAATYDEFVVRFGLDVPFEVDLPVSMQRRMLDRVKAWAAREDPRFPGGRWYFAGDLQS